MSSLKLIWGTVNTCAPGSTQEEIEQIYATHIVPVLKAVYTRPAIMSTFYFSGHMLDWIETWHSEFNSVIIELFNQRRLEILGGGYYDPIFPVIPKIDRIGQIEHLTTRLRQIFGKRPRGAWLTNFFWEPDVTSTLQSAGMEYTFLDDTFFTRAGMEPKDLLYPAITEDQGKTLVIYPVSGYGRQLFWKASPEAMLDYVMAQAGGPDVAERTVVLLYDATMVCNSAEDEASAKQAWLERFLDLVQARQESGQLETTVPSRLRKRPGYMTRAYFEAPTLEEVHAAAVGQPVPQVYADPQVLLPGINRLGYFAQKNVRHSLARYPEANLLYAKMQYLHSLVAQLRGDKFRKQASRESLWQAQNHSPFWHGPDGGLYRNRYRKLAYSQLIDAEKSTREKGIFAPGMVVLDFDFDGMNEYLFQGNEYNAYIHLKGGLVFELDYLAQPWNYADTCARHPEMYHLAAQETDGYDSFPRRLFVDHFMDPATTLEACQHGEQRECGSFCQETYQVLAMDREAQILDLAADGRLLYGGRTLPLRLEKRYEFLRHGVKVTWRLENRSDTALDLLFAPQLNLGFASTGVKDLRLFWKENRTRSVEFAPDAVALPASAELYFQHQSQRTTVALGFNQPHETWVFPLETSVKTATGIIREYQATTVVLRHPLQLDAGQDTTLSVELGFARFKA